MFKALADKWKTTTSAKSKEHDVPEPPTSNSTPSPPGDSSTTDRLWTTLKRVVPDRTALADATLHLGKTRVAAAARRNLDVAQKSIVDATSHGTKFIQDKSHQGVQAVQKATIDAASKSVQVVQKVAVGVAAKSVQAVQATTATAAATAKESAAYVHRHTTKKAVDAGAALVESSSSALQQTKARLHASTEHLRDPAKAARRLRNQVLLLVFSGIFVYGFASSLPSALVKYAAERQKHTTQRQTVDNPRVA